MTKKQGVDVVHAPVEDVRVPASLKLLVLFMVLCLLALIFVLVFTAWRSGSLAPLLP